MASFWLIKKLLILVLVCKLVVPFSVEPKYTKFQFEEQILEKLIRLEIYIENLEKQQTSLIDNALESLNKTKQDMYKSNTNLINDVLKLMNQTKQEIDESNTNLISDALNLINETKQEMDKEITNLIDTKSEIKNIKAENDGIPEQINQLKTDISKVKNTDETKVVFNVYRTSAQSLSYNHPVIFDNILQNEGNGYDVSTGLFTAPVSGIYQFNGHLCIDTSTFLDYGIIVNDVHIVKGEFRPSKDTSSDKCTSFSASYIVKKDEEVRVTAGGKLHADTDDQLSFSGALIKEV